MVLKIINYNVLIVMINDQLNNQLTQLKNVHKLE